MFRLEYLRKEIGLSQAEFAKRVNMTQQRISAYEKGKREPDIETIKQFANFFNVSIDYLLGKNDIRISKQINLSEDEVAFASKIIKLNKENQETLKSIIDGLFAKQELEHNKRKKCELKGDNK